MEVKEIRVLGKVVSSDELSKYAGEKTTMERVQQEALMQKKEKAFSEGLKMSASGKVTANRQVEGEHNKEDIQCIDLSGVKIETENKIPMFLPKEIMKNVISAELNEGKSTRAINNNPNNAYMINLDTLYQDSVAVQGEQRWYAFQTTAQKKLTIYMASVLDAKVDNDLYLFKFDAATSSVSQVSMSRNNPGMYELLSYIADAGLYFICVSAYACGAPNQFKFLARASDAWDTSEADDSMALAEEIEIGKLISRTLDNSLDEDCSIWLVAETGNYRMDFFNIPDNCNYQVQILSANQQVVTTVQKNSATNFTNVAPGGYYIKVLSPDGVVNPAVEYKFILNKIPSAITDLSMYNVWFTADNKHFVEYIKPGYVTAFSIDGVVIDFTNLYVKTGRPGTATRYCTGSSSSDSNIIGLSIGSYASTHATQVNGLLQNALLVTLNPTTYGYYVRMKIYGAFVLPSGASYPTDVIQGSDEHMSYYDCTWRAVNPYPFDYEMTFVINMKTKEAVDIFYPNMFYGSGDPSGGKILEFPSYNKTYTEGDVLVPDR